MSVTSDSHGCHSIRSWAGRSTSTWSPRIAASSPMRTTSTRCTPPHRCVCACVRVCVCVCVPEQAPAKTSAWKQEALCTLHLPPHIACTHRILAPCTQHARTAHATCTAGPQQAPEGGGLHIGRPPPQGGWCSLVCVVWRAEHDSSACGRVWCSTLLCVENHGVGCGREWRKRGNAFLRIRIASHGLCDSTETHAFRFAEIPRSALCPLQAVCVPPSWARQQSFLPRNATTPPPPCPATLLPCTAAGLTRVHT